jgi:hypothetical protein
MTERHAQRIGRKVFDQSIRSKWCSILNMSRLNIGRVSATAFGKGQKWLRLHRSAFLKDGEDTTGIRGMFLLLVEQQIICDQIISTNQMTSRKKSPLTCSLHSM